MAKFYKPSFRILKKLSFAIYLVFMTIVAMSQFFGAYLIMIMGIRYSSNTKKSWPCQELMLTGEYTADFSGGEALRRTVMQIFADHKFHL